MRLKPLARGVGALGRGALGGSSYATEGLTYQPSLLYDFALGTMNFNLPTSFTRVTPRSINDFEVKPRNILSGEVPFYGLRRVRNLITSPEAGAGWVKVTAGTGVAVTITDNYGVAPDGTTTATRLQCNLGGGTTSTDESRVTPGGSAVSVTTAPRVATSWIRTTDGSTKTIYFRSGTVALSLVVDGTWRRYANIYTAGVADGTLVSIGLRGGAAPANSDTADLLVWHPQVEEITGQSNQNPSEYVSVGAAKLNEFIETENFAAAVWVAVSAPIVTQSGLLGSAVAWQITDDSAAAYKSKNQTITVPADTLTRYFGLRIAKTTGGTAPVFAINIARNGVTNIAHEFRFDTDTGTTPYKASFDSVIDGGTYWEVRGSFVNNASTSIRLDIFPAVAAYGGVADTIAATGSATVAAPWMASSDNSYFPVGNVYPFHGAGVDGVKYFPYENGNTVTSNVVTEATGAAIPRTGRANAYLPGLAGSYFSTPDAPVNQITGDITLIWEGVWDVTGNYRLITKRSAANATFDFYHGSGIPGFYYTGASSTSTAAVPFVTDQFGAVKVERSATTGTVRFYTAPSRLGPWTQLGSDRATPAGPLPTVAIDVKVGIFDSSAACKGTVTRAQLFNTIGGTTPVLDFNPADGFTENRAFNSKLEGGGAVPTAWSQTVGTGSSAVDSTLASGDVVYVHTATAQRPFFSSAAGIATEAGVNYRFMTYLHENSAGLGLRDIISSVSFPAGVSLLYSDGTAAGATVAPIGWIWVDLIGATASGVSTVLRLGVGCAGNATGTVKFSRPQFRRLSLSPTTPLDNVYIQSALAAGRTGWDSSATGEQWSANGGAMVNRQVPGYMPDVASQNICLQSENFLLSWGAVGTPTTGATKRIGDIVLTEIGDDSAVAVEGFIQNLTFTGDGVKVRSFYFAQSTSTSSAFVIRDITAGVSRLLGVITWSNGLPVVTMTTGTLLGVDYVGNGGFRVRCATTAITAANVNQVQCYPATDAASAVANVGKIFWGAEQPENATTCSSYVPTTTGAVTRNADQMPNPLGAWFNANEGTFVMTVEGSPVSGKYYFEIQDGTNNERLAVLADPTAQLARYYVRDGAVDQVDLSGGALTPSTLRKFACCYKINDFENFVNGSRVGTGDQIGGVPTVTQMFIGYSIQGVTVTQPQAVIQSLAYYPVRLPNAQLALLSAP